MRTSIISILLLAAVAAGAFLINSCSKMTKPETVLLQVKDDPTVSFRIWFKVGSQNDPAGKEGLAALTAAMMTEGATRNNSYEEILEKLYPMAAGYGASVDKEMTIIYGRTHKDNLDAYYQLFRDAILAPAFNEDDFRRLKSEALNYLEKTLRYSSDEELGKAGLYNMIFKGTPYGHVETGTVEGLNAITLEDVKNFYAAHFTRNSVVVGLGGGFDNALVDRVTSDMRTLPDVPYEEVPVSKPKYDGQNEVLIIEKDAAATAISFGFPIDVHRGSKDFYALWIANSWFGEHRNSSSHLYQVLREARGMNYGDYSYIEAFPNGGRRQMPPTNVARRQQIFEVWIRPVPNEMRHFAFRAAVRELQKLVENGLTEEQFELTRKFLRKYVLHFAPTTMDRLGYAIDDVFYNIGESHLAKFRRMMEELTLEDVNTAIRKYLHFQGLKVVFVTKDAERLFDQLQSNEPSPIEYTSPKPDDVLREDEEIMHYEIMIPPHMIHIVPVEKMFQK
ncbi:MAG: insulinase family protein [Chlorobi bacterium]|nr:insulinase family protein [Chlorobiota bacterium]